MRPTGRLSWRDLGKPRADRAHGKTVEVTGFPVTVLPTPTADHFLMMAEPGCCQGCVPNNPLAPKPTGTNPKKPNSKRSRKK